MIRDLCKLDWVLGSFSLLAWAGGQGVVCGYFENLARVSGGGSLCWWEGDALAGFLGCPTRLQGGRAHTLHDSVAAADGTNGPR